MEWKLPVVGSKEFKNRQKVIVNHNRNHSAKSDWKSQPQLQF